MNHQPIDHHLDIVLAVLVQLDGLVERADLPVDPDPHESRPPGVFQDLPVFAFLAPHHRRQEHHPRIRGQAGDTVHDLIDRLLADHSPAFGTVGDADAREQKPQVVVDLRDGADRGTGVPLGGLLFDRDRRRQPLDVVHIGLVEAPQELAGVRRQRLHVAPLPFGEDGIEGQGGLAGTADPADHDKALPGKLEVDVLEVVLPRPFDDDTVHRSKRLQDSAGRRDFVRNLLARGRYLRREVRVRPEAM